MRKSLTSDTKLENIKSSLQEFYSYILNTNNLYNINNITRTKLKEYIRNTLKLVNTKCYDVIILRKRREEIRNDIRDLERAFVNADSTEASGAGFNNGGKVNNVELRHLKIIELKEELGKLTAQTMLIEKSLEHNRNMVAAALDFILNAENSKVMKLYYIDCYTTQEIAIENYYTTDAVSKKRKRSVNKITTTLMDLFQEN